MQNSKRQKSRLRKAISIFNPLKAAELSQKRDSEVLRKMLKLRPIDREIIRQASLGHYKTEIGEAIGRSERTVRNRLKKPEIQDALLNLEAKQDADIVETKQRIRSLVNKALDVVEEKMDSEDEAISLRAATNILDRDPESKIKTQEVPQYTILSAEGLSAMAEIMKEVKGDIYGEDPGDDPTDATGIQRTHGTA